MPIDVQDKSPPAQIEVKTQARQPLRSLMAIHYCSQPTKRNSMKHIPARISTVLFLAALPLFGFAREGAEHEKSAKTGTASSEHAATFGEPSKAATATRTVEVKMSDAMRFEPSSIAVKKGETIRFVVRNDGKIKHEMVLGTISELKEHAAMMQKMPTMDHPAPNAVALEAGKTGDLVWHFTKAGVFDFSCLQPGHFEAGMKGKINVVSK